MKVKVKVKGLELELELKLKLYLATKLLSPAWTTQHALRGETSISCSDIRRIQGKEGGGEETRGGKEESEERLTHAETSSGGYEERRGGEERRRDEGWPGVRGWGEPCWDGARPRGRGRGRGGVENLPLMTSQVGVST